MDAERPPPSRKRRLVDEIDAGLGFNPILRKDGGVGAAGSSSSKGDSRADEKGARSTAGARGDLSTSRKLPLAGSSSKAKGKAKANGNDMDSRLVGSTSIEDVADGAGDAGEEMPEHETWELPRLKVRSSMPRDLGLSSACQFQLGRTNIDDGALAHSCLIFLNVHSVRSKSTVSGPPTAEKSSWGNYRLYGKRCNRQRHHDRQHRHLLEVVTTNRTYPLLSHGSAMRSPPKAK